MDLDSDQTKPIHYNLKTDSTDVEVWNALKNGKSQALQIFYPYALPSVELPVNLRESIIEAAKIDNQHNPTKKKFSLTWGKVATTVATLLIVSLGWHNYTLRQNLNIALAEMARQKDVIAMLQNPDTHLVSLKGMDKASTANGRIIMTPGEPKSVLIVQNLPVLPTGKYYQLWSIIKGKKIPSGQFNTSENGKVLVKLSTPSALEVTGLLITIEEFSNPNNSPGLMVMTSDL